MIRAAFLLTPLALMLCLPAGARAQSYMPDNGKLVIRGAMPDPGAVVRRLGARLEPGAVLCHTAEELGQRHAALVSHGSAQGEAPIPAGCVMVQARLPVEVLERHGPGRTKVKILGKAEETGWTDAWLPDRRG